MPQAKGELHGDDESDKDDFGPGNSPPAAESSPFGEILHIRNLLFLLNLLLLHARYAPLLDLFPEILPTDPGSISAHEAAEEGMSSLVGAGVVIEIVRLRIREDLGVYRIELAFDFFVVDKSIPVMIEVIKELVDFLLVEVFHLMLRDPSSWSDKLGSGGRARRGGLFRWIGRVDGGGFAFFCIGRVGRSRLFLGHGSFVRCSSRQ